MIWHPWPQSPMDDEGWAGEPTHPQKISSSRWPWSPPKPLLFFISPAKINGLYVNIPTISMVCLFIYLVIYLFTYILYVYLYIYVHLFPHDILMISPPLIPHPHPVPAFRLALEQMAPVATLIPAMLAEIASWENWDYGGIMMIIRRNRHHYL